MIRLLAQSLSPLLPSVTCHSFSVFLPVELTDGRKGGVGGAKSHDREKAWSSLNHSILSGVNECGDLERGWRDITLMTGAEMVTQGGDMFLCLVKTSFSKRLCFSVQCHHVVLVKEQDNVKTFVFSSSDNRFSN
jgi:hypothetical protein